MSEAFPSLSVGTTWEKIFVFLRAFTASPLASSSSSSLVVMDLEVLRKLERTMRRILATLHDAEEHWNIQEESTKLRLREFKELAKDIEGVVNKYAADRRRTVGDLKRFTAIHNCNSKRKRQEENGMTDTGAVQVPYELASRTIKITERFNEIMQFCNNFTLSENDGEKRFTSSTYSSRHTSSFIFEKRILGRDDEKEILVEKLLSEQGKCGGSHVSVMAIVGTGGLGKTTLAQLVYNDPRAHQSFDKRAWVYVSELFDVTAITKNIINSLIQGTSSEYTELTDLQEVLADEIRDKRVLLVLDDVWNERGDCWELLCMPLSTARICQIIVTTRSEAVARLVQTTPFDRPRCLSFDESWSLFKQIAFPAYQGSHTPENLEEIGKNIIKKCEGLPEAIKTLGIMLRYETDKSVWEDALENELWDLEPIAY